MRGEEVREKEGYGDGEEEGEVRMKEGRKRGGRTQGGEATGKSNRPPRLLRATSLALIQQHSIDTLCTGLALLCMPMCFVQ